MRLMYMVVVKILAWKQGNSSMDDDSDLFLMWCLIYNIKTYKNDWVRFILDRMIYYMGNTMNPIFLSLFVMMILQLNGIECKKEHLTKCPKIMAYGVVSKMRYYRDSNGDYYNSEISRRRIYDDKIVDKEAPETTGSSTAGGSVTAFTHVDVKELLDDIL